MKKTFCVLSLVFLLTHLIFPKEVAVGIGWPYIAAKYNFSKKFSTEIKFASLENINVYALRGYFNFYTYKNLRSFSGIDTGYTTFDTSGFKGSGFIGGIFVGGEYFITKRLSFCCDIASTFINLKSDNLKASGIEFIANFAIYWWFLVNK
ncbi:MAG: hypothetical protein ABDH23_02770 [Endomicrobiia bacterium]